jgi:hypothetical protein
MKMFVSSTPVCWSFTGNNLALLHIKEPFLFGVVLEVSDS